MSSRIERKRIAVRRSIEGESAGSDEGPIFVGAMGVVATGWLEILWHYPVRSAGFREER